MALINCSECGREISDKASSCVHCGCPVSQIVVYQQQESTQLIDNQIDKKEVDAQEFVQINNDQCKLSLIKCVTCGREISDKAATCVHCGCPIEKEKKKIKIINGGVLGLRCSVFMDNQPIGQIGFTGNKSIDVEFPVGVHYVSVVTQVKHQVTLFSSDGTNTMVTPVTTSSSQEQDGKQFEINETDELVVIEILAKSNFLDSTGRCIIGDIKKYSNAEVYYESERQNNEDSKKNIKTLLIVFGIIAAIVSILIIISSNSLSVDEKKIYNVIKNNGYCYTGGGDTKYGFTVFSKSGDFVGCYNIEGEEIDCKLLSLSDSNSPTRIDEHRINKKLRCDH